MDAGRLPSEQDFDDRIILDKIGSGEGWQTV